MSFLGFYTEVDFRALNMLKLLRGHQDRPQHFNLQMAKNLQAVSADPHFPHEQQQHSQTLGLPKSLNQTNRDAPHGPSARPVPSVHSNPLLYFYSEETVCPQLRHQGSQTELKPDFGWTFKALGAACDNAISRYRSRVQE